MLLELIARYYKYLWLLFTAVAIVKLILAYSFNSNLSGLNGMLYALFKRYSGEEQELEDDLSRRKIMRMHNAVTMVMYILLLGILMVSLITSFFPHK